MNGSRKDSWSVVLRNCAETTLHAAGAMWEMGNCRPPSADASFRRYFRWRDWSASLVSWMRRRERGNSTFCAYCRPAGRSGATQRHNPRRADLDQGFLLLEDMGTIPTCKASSRRQCCRLDRLYKDDQPRCIRWRRQPPRCCLPDMMKPFYARAAVVSRLATWAGI